MINMKRNYSVVFVLSALFIGSFAHAQDAQKPEYAAEVPASLLTPDKVETEFLGDLEFLDGMPSESTVKKTYDFLDLSRGVETIS